MSGSATPFIDSAGIHVPSFNDLIANLQNAVKVIYGADVYLQPDSQDMQELAVFATMMNDTLSMCIAVYNNQSPATAQGAGLSSIVKLNGLQRLVPTNSTVDLILTGDVRTAIQNGAVVDRSSIQWNLPPLVVIPDSGSILVTATCSVSGAVQAAAGEITTIFTPILGWQTASNPNPAIPGAPTETDAALRLRQAQSTALPALSISESLTGSLMGLAGVTRVVNYENDTDGIDANGQPPHSIAVVVEGGDALQIAQMLLLRKGLGVRTWGDTTETIIDTFGRPVPVSFFRPTYVNIVGTINIHPLLGYSNVIGSEIVSSLVSYINLLAMGQSVLLTRLYLPMSLFGPYAIPGRESDAATFEIVSLQISRSGQPQASDVLLAYNETATTIAANWVVNLV